MNELYDAGWPQAYTNYLRASKTQNGVTANLLHTLYYIIEDYDYTFVAAQTIVSTILALQGLPTSIILKLFNIYLAADGFYKTVSDIIIGRFNVYAHENKNVFINDVRPYWAGRTVKWTAVVGDYGAALTFDYENKNYDFDDNNALLDKGLSNYFN